MFQQTTDTIALGLDAVYRRVKAGLKKMKCMTVSTLNKAILSFLVFISLNILGQLICHYYFLCIFAI